MPPRLIKHNFQNKNKTQAKLIFIYLIILVITVNSQESCVLKLFVCNSEYALHTREATQICHGLWFGVLGITVNSSLKSFKERWYSVQYE